MTDAAREADRTLLERRLRHAGLRGTDRVVVHENRAVVVSVRRDVVRVHRGFAYASDRVLRAVVAFRDGASAGRRRAARRELLAFPVHDYVPPAAVARRRSRLRPGDHETVAALYELHATLNLRHFADRLSEPTFRVSDRMRARLGEIVVDDAGARPPEITLGRWHLERDGWTEVAKTVLHEMVHQWQAETGRRLDHGLDFRHKARAVGIEPSARRRVPPDARGARRWID